MGRKRRKLPVPEENSKKNTDNGDLRISAETLDHLIALLPLPPSHSSETKEPLENQQNNEKMEYVPTDSIIEVTMPLKSELHILQQISDLKNSNETLKEEKRLLIEKQCSDLKKYVPKEELDRIIRSKISALCSQLAWMQKKNDSLVDRRKEVKEQYEKQFESLIKKHHLREEENQKIIISMQKNNELLLKEYNDLKTKNDQELKKLIDKLSFKENEICNIISMQRQNDLLLKENNDLKTKQQQELKKFIEKFDFIGFREKENSNIVSMQWKIDSLLKENNDLKTKQHQELKKLIEKCTSKENKYISYDSIEYLIRDSQRRSINEIECKVTCMTNNVICYVHEEIDSLRNEHISTFQWIIRSIWKGISNTCSFVMKYFEWECVLWISAYITALFSICYVLKYSL